MSDNNKPDWGGAPQSSNTGSKKPSWGGAPQSSNTGSKKPSWGGAPQSSNTGSKKPSWGGAPQSSNTGQSKPKWGDKPQSSNTGAAATPASSNVPEYKTITIDGVTYNVERVISAHSGEAKIFEIENQGNRYALKLYRPGVVPNHEVLERVMNLRGNGVLVDIYAHGEWKDEQTGVTHDYEIMEYCAGGSLADLPPSHDEKRMKEYAARMATALDYAHSHGILHRDVKPANFLFTDDTRTRFVLSDWGLAKILDEKGRTVTDDGRTKIYAAPEMYIYYPDNPTYVGAKTDFFSMGMTLLALWMGEGLLLADETVLVDNKMDENLPYPSRDEMSEHLLSLIKALTRRKPEARAGFDDVVRWAKGEIIYQDPNATDKVNDFRIVFSATDNLIAHNAEELGAMMWEHRELAKKYLYERQLKEWFKKAEYPELASAMHDIVEMQYPKDKDAGLFAACLFLNKNTVYEGLSGNPLVTQQDIATELLSNYETYATKLKKKGGQPLWDYLKAKKIPDETIKEFRSLVRNHGQEGVRAVAYMLDPDRPFVIDKVMLMTSGMMEHTRIPDLESMNKWLADQSLSCYMGYHEVDFITWLAGRSPELAGRAKQIADDPDATTLHKQDLIIYSIFPEIGYDLYPYKESKRITPEQIADRIMEKVAEDNETWLVDNLGVEFDNSPIQAYLTARNKYAKQISWARYCLDMDSADNQKKGGPYNLRIARMKLAAGFKGGKTEIEVDGVKYTSANDVKKLSSRNLSKSAQNILADWLTLFYQEDPNADYRQKSYYKRTAEYHDAIRLYLPDCDYVSKSHNKWGEVLAAESNYKSSLRKVATMRWLIILLCLLPLALTIAGGTYLVITQGAAGVGEVMNTVGYWSGLILGIVAGLAAFGETENLITGGIVGLIVFVVVKVSLALVTPAVPWIILGFFLLQLILGIKALIKHSPDLVNSVNGNNIKEVAEREVMAVAFGKSAQMLPGGDDGTQAKRVYNWGTDGNKDNASVLLKKFLWLLLLTAGSVAFCWWIYDRAENPSALTAVESGTGLLKGDFSGNVKGTPLEVSFTRRGEGMDAEMNIHYRSGATKQTMQTRKATAWPVVMYKSNDPNISLTIDTAYMDAGKTVAKGSYLNSKGNRQPVEIHKN